MYFLSLAAGFLVFLSRLARLSCFIFIDFLDSHSPVVNSRVLLVLLLPLHRRQKNNTASQHRSVDNNN